MKALADSLEHVLRRIGNLTEKIKAQRPAIEKKLRSCRQPVCQTHKTALEIDIEASVNASIRAGRLDVIPKPCRRCEEQAECDWLGRLGVPPRLRHASLDNWIPHSDDEQSILESVRRFIQSGWGFLCLFGPVGLGKSHLAVGVLRAMRGGRYITQLDMLTALRKTYKDRMAEDIVTACQRARLLVLDEMGFSGGGRDELPTLHSVLGSRHSDMKPTVITTNMTGEEFAEFIGERLTDRIREGGVIIEMDGKSRRVSRKQ